MYFTLDGDFFLCDSTAGAAGGAGGGQRAASSTRCGIELCPPQVNPFKINRAEEIMWLLIHSIMVRVPL